MKLIKQSHEILTDFSKYDGDLEQIIFSDIEVAGRTCYKSEENIKEGSAESFTNRMIKSGHCYTGNVEILTIDGWVKFKDYSGSKVASINKDGTLNKFEIPSSIINKVHSGNFYNFPSMGIEVTDKHRMFGMFANQYKDRNNLFKGDVFECGTDYYDANKRKKTLGERWFRTLSSCSYIPKVNPYYQLVGFWLGDGIANTPKNSLNFHLKRKRKVEYLKGLCNELNFKYTYIKNRFKITEVGIGATFSNDYVKDGVKFIDSSITDQSIIYSIIDGLINSDGSKQPTGTTFMNKSDYLINFVLSKGCLVGYNVVEGTTEANGTRVLFFLKRNHILNNDSRRVNSKVIISNKTEKVYCVTVSTGLIMVRGVNGKTSICGNCAMLEHGSVYLTIPHNKINALRYMNNKYSVSNPSSSNAEWCVTTNMRLLIENNWLDDLQYLCLPTYFHERRISVRFICDRAVQNQLVRHRSMSFAVQSQRYCNYSKDKFGNEVSFVLPSWVDVKQLGVHDSKRMSNAFKNIDTFCESDRAEISFLKSISDSEQVYFDLLDMGLHQEQARSVLPNATATEMVVTGFLSDWIKLFNLRTDKSAHPDMIALIEPLKDEFKERGWC